MPAAGSYEEALAARREMARRTGSLMSPGDVAEMLGGEAVELSVVTYRFSPGGRCAPPVDVVVRCEPGALDGVRRSMARLLESRGWSSRATVSSTREARSALGFWFGDGERGTDELQG